MTERSEWRIYCPYCGEKETLLIDPQDAGEEYTEDCQICCRPMIIHVCQEADGELTVTVRSENDA
ncbi:MAG: CPXCG motif-containing cysteine-rich protein [Pseudomonadota bacterium]|nr:CPXCG motif-containing cysteine-rich protein [Pseudomonadota bacterium]